MEDINNVDYAHVKSICKDFERKDWGEYCDLLVQGDLLLLADVFNNCQNMHLEIWELDKNISASGWK